LSGIVHDSFKCLFIHNYHAYESYNSKEKLRVTHSTKILQWLPACRNTTVQKEMTETEREEESIRATSPMKE